MSIYNELNPEFPIKGFLRIRPSIFDTPKKYYQKTENIFDVWYMSVILFWTTFPLSIIGKIKSIFVLLISIASVLIIVFLLNKKD